MQFVLQARGSVFVSPIKYTIAFIILLVPLGVPEPVAPPELQEVVATDNSIFEQLLTETRQFKVRGFLTESDTCPQGIFQNLSLPLTGIVINTANRPFNYGVKSRYKLWLWGRLVNILG